MRESLRHQRLLLLPPLQIDHGLLGVVATRGLLALATDGLRPQPRLLSAVVERLRDLDLIISKLEWVVAWRGLLMERVHHSARTGHLVQRK